MRTVLIAGLCLGLFLHAAGVSAQNCSLSFPGSSIRIVSGTLNGQSLDPAKPRVTVDPGAALTGTVRIRVVNTGPSGSVFPVCWTPSWGGDHAATGQSISGDQEPGTTEYDVPVSLTASTTPGTHNLFFAAQWEMDCGDVLSCTAWNLPGGERWNDGRDVADWTNAQVEQAVAQGWVCSAWDNVDGMITQGVPAAAVQVNVHDPVSGVEEGTVALALRPENPVVGPATVRFSLASEERAVLAVYDVGGRRVVSREVGTSGPGWHTVRLGSLPAGVYLVRLSQAGRNLSARMTVIH